MTHTYVWRNNPVRAALYGHACRIVVVAKSMSSVLIETDDGRRVVTSLRALRRIA